MASNKNSNLHSAKKAKNDEFYTQLSDIEKELRHYKKHFRDKTVFCNCDDPEWSNFWQYFSLNFDRLQLRRLIATHYEIDKQSYMLEMWRDDSGVHTKINTLRQNGDFRSHESIALLQQADIVVTNPPFSLFREYVAQLMEYEKKFLIIGSKNAITYKEFFPLLKDNKVWIGYNLVKSFGQPDGTFKTFGNIGWYTNLDIPKRHEPLIMVKRYDPEAYPHYDNYDAINCDKVADIPMDYFESWGVTHADYALLNAVEWEVTREDAERKWIIPASGALRQALNEHSEGYREIIEAALTGALYCNGEVGVPITVCDELNPEQFEIIGNGGSYKGEGSVADALYVTHTHTHTHTHTPNAGRSSNESSYADVRCKYCSGIIGVPVTFLDKFCPEQFALLGHEHDLNGNGGTGITQFESNGKGYYKRLLVRSILFRCNGSPNYVPR